MKRNLAALALAGGAVALGIYAYHVQVHDLRTAHAHAVAQVAVGWAFVFAGLVAWLQRPRNRLGPLIVAAGLAYLARQLRYSYDAWLFTIFFALGELPYALIPHSVLAYPTGKVVGRAERALVKVGYASLLVVPFVILLFYDGTRQLLFYSGPPHRNFLLVHGSADTVEALQKSLVVFYFGILGTIFIALIVRRLWRATPRSRRILAPLVVAAVAFSLRALYECVKTFVSQPVASEYLFWWQVAALVALPIALVVGMLRAHLARAGVGELVLELEHAPPEEIRGALARSLRDPTLEIAFWVPELRGYTDAAGRPVELPKGPERAVTLLLYDSGEPLAAIVHDPSLLEEPKLVQAACAAARLALENARLQAETRAQLAEVKQSRVRIVTATDEERRRIERDLHDGAQQRLAALALQLRSAQMRLGSRDVDPEVTALLDSAVAELQAANEELRELVRGVYPAILTEEGLAAALESLALRNPFPIELDVPRGRFPARVEATAYFVASEGLANVAKHARASRASVCIARRDGILEVEIEDDGVGGARLLDGSGLTGLADRVEALGGRLRLQSPSGEGTLVVAEIPCES
ncbi:MAG TPA: histidine kinase [Gaiellaceae bacterium]